MRPYRGQTKDGEWVYGWYAQRYVVDTLEDVIYESEGLFPIPVLPATVGQDTGLKDKNGKAIWDDSVVKYWSSDGKKSAVHRVMWDEQKIGYVLSQSGLKKDEGFWMRNWNPQRAEVIGTIHGEAK